MTVYGQVSCKFRNPWKKGTTGVMLNALTFISRLAALVPYPRTHLLTYHGILAPAASLRDKIIPDPPVEGVPLDHPYYDPLWAEIASLGVPLGTHEASFHKMGSVGYVGAKHANNTRIPYAENMLAFGLGQMVAALMFTGSICARHPELKLVFTESSVGWSATWFHFLDDKWEYCSLSQSGKDLVPEHPPSHYFAEQCAISGSLSDPGQAHAMLAGLEDNVLLATDFPHPEDMDGWRILDAFDASPNHALTDAQVRKICWDNPSRLYGIT